MLGKPAKHTENTLVFLDTGFFRHYNARDSWVQTFLRFSREGKITLCTSQIALEEWHSQKVLHHMKWCATQVRERSGQIEKNLVSDAILVDFPPPVYPSEEEVDQVANRTIEAFVAEHKIHVMPARLEHIKKTFRSYFRGLPPFRGPKEKIDIPDSWIYEAAKDAKADPKFKRLKYRYCMGGDKGLNDALAGIGITLAGKDTLIDIIQQEQAELLSKATTIAVDAPAAQVSENDAVAADTTAATPAEIRENEAVPKARGDASAQLDNILESALTPQYREIFLRVIGWAYTLERPTKLQIEQKITNQGYDLEQVRRSYGMLADPALGLFNDTAAFLLPLNPGIGMEAQTRIISEIAEELDR